MRKASPKNEALIMQLIKDYSSYDKEYGLSYSDFDDLFSFLNRIELSARRQAYICSKFDIMWANQLEIIIQKINNPSKYFKQFVIKNYPHLSYLLQGLTRDEKIALISRCPMMLKKLKDPPESECIKAISKIDLHGFLVLNIPIITIGIFNEIMNVHCCNKLTKDEVFMGSFSHLSQKIIMSNKSDPICLKYLENLYKVYTNDIEAKKIIDKIKSHPNYQSDAKMALETLLSNS